MEAGNAESVRGLLDTGNPFRPLQFGFVAGHLNTKYCIWNYIAITIFGFLGRFVSATFCIGMEPHSEDKETGARLRQFRESTRLTRTAFALSVGLGAERLASYESGRVPLPYEVFLAIVTKYPLNPVWLATGTGEMALPVPISLRLPEFQIPSSPRALFREVYADYLESPLSEKQWIVKLYMAKALEAVNEWASWSKHHPGDSLTSPDSFHSMVKLITAAKTELERVVGPPKNNEKKVLLENFSDAKALHMAKLKSLWETLRIRLGRLLSVSGAKTALADALGVTPSAVTQWLSENGTTPTAETTLRLLEWVQVEEAKQKSSGRAQTRPEPKTQVRQSDYEKPNSGRKKR